ncbi:hypothetical protein Asi02nite_19950 [Asanoa siamensis]|uniref:SnoaL-like domain-containing protein n=2 Tax=Asanoa siamensis TaxID=926357 RepID=A0ABQ4CMG8_9ACTN|nr:hypothetical protein Asi02nite_19950 [Asanoa siamensis]
MIIERAFAELIGTGTVDGLDTVLRDDFVHHRPDGRRTKDEWLDAVRTAMGPLAGMRVEVDHMLADGDHVVMHSRRSLPGGPTIAVVDIWRFADGRVVEAWETIEPVHHAAANMTWWQPDHH